MNLPTFLQGSGLPLAEIAREAPASGLSVGTAVLILLTGAVIFLIRSLVNLRTEVEELKASLPPETRSTPVPASAPAAVPGPTAAELVVIAAAVHCMLGPGARIVAVGPAVSPELQAWSHEGRRQVFHSHQTRK